MASPADRFRQSISFADLTGRDPFGKPTMGAISTAPARVQPKRKLIRDAAGVEHMASFVVYTEAAISMKSRVWFPGDSTIDFNKARRPIEIDEYVDGIGQTRYRKVWF